MPTANTSSEIASIGDAIEWISGTGLTTLHHTHARTWFRGQPEKGLPLLPKVYRPPFSTTGDGDNKRLTTEQHLNQDFKVMSAGIRSGDQSDAELYFLQQHYGLPTRLLDWSTVPLVALYFAVTSHPEKDGEVFVMDAYQLAEDQQADDFKGIATSGHPRFQAALKVLVEWGRLEEFPSFIIPVRPDHIDRRVTLQKGCFTFHVPRRPVLRPEDNRTLKSLTIPAISKAAIIRELALLGVDDFTIYGDMDHLASRLKSAYGV